MKTELGMAFPTNATPLGAYRVIRCHKFAFYQ